MEILRITEVAKRTALSPSSIYKQIRLGNFPKGTKITARATGWSSEAIDEWIIAKLNAAKLTAETAQPGSRYESD
ncbi:AlpA family transcriptional regulator [Pseudomonadales bacterium]|nr:AlpA family transcriptional regulator [Pseudomonadales bacterium]MDB2596148.1 AlpA family transcriptional regulator [Pseudomonadales bacterium]